MPPLCTRKARALAGCSVIGLRPGDEVLVPAYHHGSEIESLIRAGLVCRFYEATATLAPDRAELEELLSPSTRALYLIHYLGFAQDASRWRRWCDEHGLLLLEDAAQAWLATCDGKPAGSFGDLSIICLYKTFGFPDGGALVCANPPSAVAPTNKKVSLLGLRHAAWVVGRSGILPSRRGGCGQSRNLAWTRSLTSAIPLRHPRMRSDSSFREPSGAAQRQPAVRITSCCSPISQSSCCRHSGKYGRARRRLPFRWSLRTKPNSSDGERQRCRRA